jgi:hypothetical protein
MIAFKIAILHLLPRNKFILPSSNVVFTSTPEDPQQEYLQEEQQPLTT